MSVEKLFASYPVYDSAAQNLSTSVFSNRQTPIFRTSKNRFRYVLNL